MATSIQKRFDAAWKRASNEHCRLMLKYSYPSNVPPGEWAKYESYSARVEAIANEAGPEGSVERETAVYGAR